MVDAGKRGMRGIHQALSYWICPGKQQQSVEGAFERAFGLAFVTGLQGPASLLSPSPTLLRRLFSVLT
jgi:hypothetical protein